MLLSLWRAMDDARLRAWPADFGALASPNKEPKGERE